MKTDLNGWVRIPTPTEEWEQARAEGARQERLRLAAELEASAAVEIQYPGRRFKEQLARRLRGGA